MKKFLVQCACMLTLLAITIMGNVFLLSPAEDDYLLATFDKNKRLASLDKPKLVLIGGSNLCFGLNSNVLTDSLPFSIVNMGLHASIGMRYIMQEVEPFMKAGDVIVLVPEYEQFIAKTFEGEFTLMNLLAYQKRYSEIFGNPHLYPLMSECLRSNFSKLYIKSTNGSGIYSRRKFNKYGDNMGYRDKPLQPIVDYGIKGEPQEYIVKQIVNYIERMKKRGITCFIFPPVFKQQSAELSFSYIQQTEKLLKTNGIAFQVSPAKYYLKDTLFYDTRYHLRCVL